MNESLELRPKTLESTKSFFPDRHKDCSEEVVSSENIDEGGGKIPSSSHLSPKNSQRLDPSVVLDAFFEDLLSDS